MRTLHLGLHVADLDRSLAFYRAVGYETVGEVPETPLGRLTMLKLPDDEFVAIELVSSARAPGGAGTLSHLVVQVESLETVVAALRAAGLEVQPVATPGDGTEPRTAWLSDPDGTRIELVEWAAGHPAGMTAADFHA